MGLLAQQKAPRSVLRRTKSRSEFTTWAEPPEEVENGSMKYLFPFCHIQRSNQ